MWGRPERNAVAFSLVATYRRVNGRSVAMNVSVCLSVRENISEITCQIFASFFCVLFVAMTRYSSGGIGIRYVCTSGFVDDFMFSTIARNRLTTRKTHSTLLNGGGGSKICHVTPLIYYFIRSLERSSPLSKIQRTWAHRKQFRLNFATPKVLLDHYRLYTLFRHTV